MILRDDEILPLVMPTENVPPIANVAVPNPPFGKTSPIQPASLDLRIGKIFAPETGELDVGGMRDPSIDHVLLPGHTAIVVTLEELNFPAHIAAFGFPPTRISTNAILMTNPGHIDPGFKGYLSFTVINMGKKPFRLTRGETIVTCLIVNMRANVAMDYTAQGHGASDAEPRQDEFDHLSKDFLDVGARAEKIAREIAKETESQQWNVTYVP